MKLLLRLGLLFLISSTSPYATAQTITLSQAQSGRVVQVVSVLIRRTSEGDFSYTAQAKHTKFKSHIKFTQAPEIVLADLNFDGFADLWVIGCTSGQCRATQSEVWLYDRTKHTYLFNTVLSKLPNLEIDSATQIIKSGISNMGCAAQAFYHETYRWIGKELQLATRREQDCGPNEIIYREYVVENGVRRMITEVEGTPDEAEYKRRQDQ